MPTYLDRACRLLFVRGAVGLAAFCRVSGVRLHTPVPTGAVRRPCTWWEGWVLR
jgi:hypothetical protein